MIGADLRQKVFQASHHKIAIKDTRTITETQKLLAQAHIDIIIFSEVGLDPLMYYISFARMAPVQLMYIGHGVSPGHSGDINPTDTIDYFISSDLFEPDPDAFQMYSEQLVRFETLGRYIALHLVDLVRADQQKYG